MKYYKYLDKSNNVIQLEMTDRTVTANNVIEITEKEYEEIFMQVQEKALEEAYKDYIIDGGTLRKEEWSTQQMKKQENV